MTDPITQVPCDPLLQDFTSLILISDNNTLAFVGRLGFAYDEDNPWPRRWTTDVLQWGVAAGANQELLRWLIFNEFAKTA
jgi:hypothetical protein